MASLQNKKGVWYGIISLRRRRKKWVKIGRCSKTLAEKILTKMEYDIISGNFGLLVIKPIGFADFAPIYLEKIQKTKAPKSCLNERGFLKNLTAYFGNKNLASITKEDVENYRDLRLDKVKSRTVNLELIALSSLLKKAIEMKHLEKLPWNKIPMVKVRDARGTNFLSVEQVNRLKEASSPWLYPFVCLALHSGMRLNEMLWLEWSQIDFERRVIRLQNKPGFTIKNLRPREIPIDDDLYEVLQHHFAFYPRINALKKNAQAYSPRQERQQHWVFCHRDGSRLKNFKTSFRNALQRAGIQGIRKHDLRHTFASHLTMEGVSLKAIQETLGHKSINITMDIYGHLTPEHIRASVNRLPYRSLRESKVIPFPLEKS